jgi:hypothetical protein
MAVRRFWLTERINAGAIGAAATLAQQRADEDFCTHTEPADWCRRVAAMALRDGARDDVDAATLPMARAADYLGRLVELQALLMQPGPAQHWPLP